MLSFVLALMKQTEKTTYWIFLKYFLSMGP